MKRLTRFVAIVALAPLGCADVEQREQRFAGADGAEEEPLGEVESAVQFCGVGNCPSGYHATGYGCSIAQCGSCFGGINMMNCEPNAGQFFTQCGTFCPSGYHATAYGCDLFNCGACNGGINNAGCARNAGASFVQCGTGCPSGYHPTGFGCSFACGFCNGGNNTAGCEQDAGASFSQCGFGCPSGYHVGATFCDSFDCGSCNGGVNASTCVSNEPPMTCRLSVSATQVRNGDTATLTVTSAPAAPAGAQSYFYGTKNGVTDANRLPTGTTTGSWVIPNNDGGDGTYVRYVQFENAQGQVVCRTNPVTVTFWPGCALESSLAVVPPGGSTVLTLSGTGAFPDGVQSYFFGSKDGTPDADGQPTGAATGSWEIPNLPGLAGTYERYARFENAQGTLVCETNSVSVTLQP